MEMLLRVKVDEEKVKEMSGMDDVYDAVYFESGWLEESGIHLVEIEKPEEQK